MHNELYARNPKAVTYSIENIFFLFPKIWALALQNKKDST